jgi:hypothetical protein
MPPPDPVRPTITKFEINNGVERVGPEAAPVYLYFRVEGPTPTEVRVSETSSLFTAWVPITWFTVASSRKAQKCR